MKPAKIVLVFFLFFLVCTVLAQPPKDKFSAKDYIEQYKNDAIKDMLKTGVPASITLAQGMLESRNGNSTLALEAKNHFGIKCHKDWQGETFHQDDDTKNECFRKYNSVLESYDDHSNFLKTRSRYSFLFDIEKTNYKAWAEGLKKAGYATNPQYPQLLIKLIEENKLYEFDNSDKPITDVKSDEKGASARTSKGISLVNNVQCVTVLKGEGVLAIAEKYNLDLWQIYKYNDLDRDATLKEGQRIFIKPKRRKGSAEFHTVKPNETMQSISQQYGIKLKHLYRKNRMEPGTEPSVGQKLWMQTRKPK